MMDTNSLVSIRTFQPKDFNKKGLCWNVVHRGDYIYTGYENGQLVVFDRRSNSQQVLEIKVHDEIISALDVKDNVVITSSPDSTIKITNIINNYTETSEDTDDNLSASAHHTIDLKCKGISRVGMRTDNKLFAAAGWDGGLRLYGCKKYKLLGVVEAHSPDTITDMIMFDNKIVCSGRDSKISFWTFY